MMLPIFFHKRRNTYRQGKYRPTNNTRRRGRTRKSPLVLCIITTIITATWAIWYLYPTTEEEKKAVQEQLLTETRYIIAAGNTDILSFTTTRGDTILEGISSADTIKETTITKDTIAAQWVRKWEYLPYNGHNLVAEAADTPAICHKTQKEIATLLARQAQYIAQEQKTTKTQQADVDYFLRTHTVLDNGFDIVARYRKKLEQHSVALTQAATLVQKALKGKNLSLRMERRYYIIPDTTGKRTECIPHKVKDNLVHLTPERNTGKPTITSRLCRKKDAPAMLKARRPHKKKAWTTAIDSIGTYTGGRDTMAMPHGYGQLHTHQGAYYEGEWTHGKRNGVGFSITPGQRLRLGEWKDDKFLGERITYTPERIYGIDISRHQHEKGRKRYSINWQDLRITSLGKKSKKIIHGKVDYPVRFVFIKATEGVTIRNKYFSADYAAARKHGYRTGAYHFFSIRTPGRQQAINFLRNSRYTKGDLPPVLDLEPTDAQIRKAGGIQALFRNVRTWLNTVENQRGVRPILYISQRFVNKYLSLAPDLHNNYDVWIARYGEYKPDVNLVYWQLSPDGRVKGIHGDVDINVYNGFNF